METIKERNELMNKLSKLDKISEDIKQLKAKEILKDIKEYKEKSNEILRKLDIIQDMLEKRVRG